MGSNPIVSIMKTKEEIEEMLIKINDQRAIDLSNSKTVIEYTTIGSSYNDIMNILKWVIS